MSAIHYWKNYLKFGNENINTNDYFLTFYIDKEAKNKYNGRCYFFSKHINVIKFVKYIVLPSFTYSKITNIKDEIVIEAIDYKEMLNFFTINDNYYDKELIKKYSYFFNSLEELEYEDFGVGEEKFKNICKEISLYFSKDEFLKVAVNYYKNFDNFKKETGIELEYNEFLSSCREYNEMEQVREFINRVENNSLIC